MIENFFKKLIILTAFLLVSLFWLFVGKNSQIFYGDALGYYFYLPSTFIYHNIKTVEETPIADNFPENTKSCIKSVRESGFTSSLGYKVNQYTYGVALMEAPFFLTAHLYETLSNGDANGYSSSYSLVIKLSSIMYTLLGLLLVYRILRTYFLTLPSLIVTLLVLVATNLFWFTLYQAGMSHVPLFFLWAAAIYLTIKVYRTSTPGLFLLLGLVCGIITLIRPTDILCLLIPLLYNVYNRETLLNRWKFLWDNMKSLVLFVVAFIIPIVPQLFYWKAVSGHYLFYSYGGQTFNWSHPKIMEGLFSASNGWLFYTPIMIFSISGMFLFRSVKKWAWILWIVVPLYIYIIYSWYCYNYINGFGSRPMIDIYPLLSIPFAASFVAIIRKALYYRIVLTLVCILFVAMNVSYSMQQANGLLFSEESSILYNWQILFKRNISYNDLVVLDNNERQPNLNEVSKIGTLACFPSTDSLSDHYTKISAGHYAYHMVTEEYLPEAVSISYDSTIFKNAKWIRCMGEFLIPYFVDHYRQHLMILTIERDGQLVEWEPCKIDTKIGLADSSCGHISDIKINHVETNRWGPVSYFVRIPKNIKQGDLIKLIIWNIGKVELFADDLCLEIYR